MIHNHSSFLEALAKTAPYMPETPRRRARGVFARVAMIGKMALRYGSKGKTKDKTKPIVARSDNYLVSELGTTDDSHPFVPPRCWFVSYVMCHTLQAVKWEPRKFFLSSVWST